MSGYKSTQQKKIEQTINKLFEGLDDDVLKNVLLCAYAGQDENILDEIRVAREKELAELIEKMTNVDNADQLLEPTQVIQLPSEEEKNYEPENPDKLISSNNINGKD